MGLEQRHTKRLIMRVPMWVRAVREGLPPEKGVVSLNISMRGTYFAAQDRFQVGEKVEVRLKMPEVVISGQKTEWRFTGRVTHVDRLGTNGMSGVGVHFLCYSAEKPTADA